MRRRRRKEEPLISRKEPAAGGLASPVGDASRSGAVDSHHVLLVARMAVACALECQPFSVVAEIRFGVLAAKGQLTNRREMSLTGDWLDRSYRGYL